MMGIYRKIKMLDVNNKLFLSLVFFFVVCKLLSFPVFFKEVLDSLQRSYEEKVQPENLVMEINGSRSAYNVFADDVIKLVLEGLLSLPQQLNKVCFHHHAYFIL